MTIESAFEMFLGQEVLVYTESTASLNGGAIECVLEEIGDGWIKISQGENEEKNVSIVNLGRVIRIREYPRKKNGKKRIVISD